MDKVDINLLPSEVSVEQLKLSKFGRVQAISIWILLTLILLASLSVGIRILQGQKLTKLHSETKNLEDKVTALKDKEATLVVLKNRIAAISQLVSSKKIQSTMFNLITDQVPPDVTVTGISVDRIGSVVISMLVPSSDSLAQLLSSLTTPDAFENISRIDIESLSLGRDGVYKVSLKILAKN